MKRMIVGGLLGLGLIIGAAAWTVPSEATSDCKRACYETKSKAYERCRQIPPGDRDARVRCFRTADQALKRCLASCGR